MRHARAGATRARAGCCAALIASSLAGCAAPVGVVVVQAPVPGLRRERYVLPPEPPPPPLRTIEERRALEAEWPPVSVFPEDPTPPDGPLRVRAPGPGAAGPLILRVEPRPSASPVQTACAGSPTVHVQVVRDRHRAAPRIVVVRGR